MKPVRRIEGRVAVLDRPDVDTDQIMPKQFLKLITRTGFGQYVFFDWRKDPDFELSRPEYEDARILIAGRNFGCGSSRENAAWGLQEYGFDAIIAPSFGDIFRQNSLKIGMLPVRLDDETVRSLHGEAELAIRSRIVEFRAIQHPATQGSDDLFTRHVADDCAHLSVQVRGQAGRADSETLELSGRGDRLPEPAERLGWHRPIEERHDIHAQRAVIQLPVERIPPAVGHPRQDLVGVHAQRGCRAEQQEGDVHAQARRVGVEPEASGEDATSLAAKPAHGPTLYPTPRCATGPGSAAPQRSGPSRSVSSTGSSRAC